MKLTIYFIYKLYFIYILYIIIPYAMPVQKHHLLMLLSVKLKSWTFNELIVFTTLLSAHKYITAVRLGEIRW